MSVSARIPEASMPWIAALVGAGAPVIATSAVSSIIRAPIALTHLTPAVFLPASLVAFFVVSCLVGWLLANTRLALWAICGHVALQLVPFVTSGLLYAVLGGPDVLDYLGVVPGDGEAISFVAWLALGGAMYGGAWFRNRRMAAASSAKEQA